MRWTQTQNILRFTKKGYSADFRRRSQGEAQIQFYLVILEIHKVLLDAKVQESQ